ncbi:MAG: hypothetical protein IJL64_05740 [Bacteroidales bacterium]|nr:hypothetical protein [Bacteroidales bacterium]MBQ7212948.1 hypothetical protein [Bacteroidales bacterium]
MSLQSYLAQLVSLRAERPSGQVTPHKAILLLSIIDMIDMGFVKSPEIEMSKVLERIYRVNWQVCAGKDSALKPRVGRAFWALRHEPFCTMRRSDGGRLEDMTQPPTAVMLRRCSVQAVLDKELFDLLMDEDTRMRCRNVLKAAYIGL